MSRFCTNCGKPAFDDAAFCVYCGAKLTAANPAPVQQPVAPQQPPVPPQGYMPQAQVPPQGARINKKKKSPAGIIIAIAAVLVVIGAAVAAVLLLGGKKQPDGVENTTPPAVTPSRPPVAEPKPDETPDFEKYGIPTALSVGAPAPFTTCPEGHPEIGIAGTVTVTGFTREAASADTVAYGESLGYDFSDCDMVRLEAMIRFDGENADLVRLYGANVSSRTEDYYRIAQFDDSREDIEKTDDGYFRRHTVSVGGKDAYEYIWRSQKWRMPQSGSVFLFVSFKAAVPNGYDGLVVGWKNAAIGSTGYLYEDYTENTAPFFQFFRLGNNTGSLPDFEKYGFVENLAVGMPVTYTTPINDGSGFTTTGTLTLESCTVEPVSEDTVAFGLENGLDFTGYEMWRLHAVTDFRTYEAVNYGVRTMTLFLNYYDIAAASASSYTFYDTLGNECARYTVEYNGEQRYLYKWLDSSFTLAPVPEDPAYTRALGFFDLRVLVPADYDGVIFGFANEALYAEGTKTADVFDPAQVFLHRLKK